MRTGVAVTLIVVGLLFIGLAQTGEAAWPDDMWVSGTVIDDKGEPFAGVNITAENTTTGMRFYIMTGANGTYNISLPVGNYNVSAVRTNYSANITYQMLNVSENLTNLDFTLSELLGTVTGFVTNGTVPIASATVYLCNAEYNYSAVTTIPLGQYEITDIEPGSYVARAEKEGYLTNYSAIPVMVERGKTTEVDFNLTAEPATLYGKVMFGTKGLSGVQVQVVSNDIVVTAMTDTIGNYTITDIPVGHYTVTFTKKEFVSQEFQVTLGATVPTNLDVSLEREAGTGGGFIPGFDLPHSLMVVGLMLGLITLIFALFVRLRVEKNPELLDKEEIEEEESE
ncbi:MAG TPA: carboxypeptidase-like regulatory domain-containing protein [Methanomassiliicoccales archaeon]|nr:carboxypeptidase-like regulatory domain-containing protein [Methanomassiliicoccales archaeon]